MVDSRPCLTSDTVCPDLTIFHIIEREAWLRAKNEGEYCPASLELEGFIHFSEESQLLSVANRFYSGKSNLLVISVQKDKLRAELRYEEVEGEAFPHLYGPLNLDAVVEAVALPVGADGRFVMPPL